MDWLWIVPTVFAAVLGVGSVVIWCALDDSIDTKPTHIREGEPE